MSDDTLQVAVEQQPTLLRDFLQECFSRLNDGEGASQIHFTSGGYNPETKDGYEIRWALAVVGIEKKSKLIFN